MTGADHSSGNVFSGVGDNVVQAAEIRGDVHLHAAPSHRAPVPRQLPAATGGFVNRAVELARLDDCLEVERSCSVVISAIAGTAGAGKTALALHWGHRVRGRFPDGDLYVNLRGYDTGAPVRAEQALQRFLYALGVPARSVPADVEAQAALYRSVLNDRRVLVVLDNAAGVEQVRPLLPAAPGCLVLVTSRSRLSGLSIREGAQAMSLDLLSEEEGVALLRETVGASRVDAEPGAGVTLVRRCGYLPLALRIVAERALAAPGGSLAELGEDLAAERDRLDVLSSLDDDEASVRAVFSWSYTALPEEAARVFRLLGLHPGDDISTAAASALAALSPPRTRRLLEALVHAHLLEQTARDRYRFHDLLRAYAAERAENDEPEHEREAALDRLFGWYLHTADTAVREGVSTFSQFPVALPSMDDAVRAIVFSKTEDALSWLDSESQNIEDVIRFAAREGKGAVAWRLPTICLPYLRLRRLWSIWLNTHDLGISAARASGEDYGEAALLNNLGVLHRERGEVDEGLACFDQSLLVWERIGDDWGTALALSNLSGIYRRLGLPEEAYEAAQRSLFFWRELGDQGGQAEVEYGMGILHRNAGRLQESLESLGVAYRLFAGLGTRLSEAASQVELAATYRVLDDSVKAEELLRKAQKAFRESGDNWRAATTSDDLGRLLSGQGRTAEAREAWLAALPVFESEDPERATQIRARLDALPDIGSDPSQG